MWSDDNENSFDLRDDGGFDFTPNATNDEWCNELVPPTPETCHEDAFISTPSDDLSPPRFSLCDHFLTAGSEFISSPSSSSSSSSSSNFSSSSSSFSSSSSSSSTSSSSSSSSSNTSEVICATMTREQALRSLFSEVRTNFQLLSCLVPSEDEMLLLLDHFSWDRSHIVSYLSSSSDQSFQSLPTSDSPIPFFSNSSLNSNNSNNSNSNSSSSSSSSNSILPASPLFCQVCFEDLSDQRSLPDPPFPLHCGHNLFCRVCWRDHFHAQLCGEANDARLTCMYRGCALRIPLSFVLSLPCDCTPSSAALYTNAFFRRFCAAKCILECTSPSCDALLSVPELASISSSSSSSSSSTSSSSSSSSSSSRASSFSLTSSYGEDRQTSTELLLSSTNSLYSSSSSSSSSDISATCSLCKTRFCASCRLQDREFPPHAPLPCPQRWQWAQLESSLAEESTMAFIKATARQCPFCHNFQERVAGTCNHIVCGRHTHGGTKPGALGCGREWCWYCRRDWKLCGYRCSAKEQEAQESQEASRKLAFFKFFDMYNDQNAWLVSSSKGFLQAVAARAGHIVAHPEMHPFFRDPDPGRLLLQAASAQIEARELLRNAFMLSFFLGSSEQLQATYNDAQVRLQRASDQLWQLLDMEDYEGVSSEELAKQQRLTQQWAMALRKRMSLVLGNQDLRAATVPAGKKKEGGKGGEEEGDDPFQILLDQGISEETALGLLDAANYDLDLALDLFRMMND